LSDCIAQLRSCISRSVKFELGAAVEEPGAGDFAESDMTTGSATKFE